MYLSLLTKKHSDHNGLVNSNIVNITTNKSHLCSVQTQAKQAASLNSCYILGTKHGPMTFPYRPFHHRISYDGNTEQFIAKPTNFTRQGRHSIS